ncbi:MAG: PilZ domain-containing protein [Planctomycetota bacterium]
MSPDSPLSPRSSRRHPRQAVQGVSTPFGQVIDVSESGACVFRKGATVFNVGDQVVFQVREPGLTLDLKSRIVRSEPLGLRRYEVGLEFIDPAPEDRVALIQLMTQANRDYSPPAWLAA